MSSAVFAAVLATLSCVILRLYSVMPGKRTITSRGSIRSTPCSVAVFLGSGGHTSEALALVSSLNFSRYFPRTYIISQGDSLSAQKVVTLESDITIRRYSTPPGDTDASKSYSLVVIPRARKVHQSILTTPFTASLSLASCIYYVTVAPLLRRSPFADVLILNGPGTCFVLCIAVYLNRFLGLWSPKLVYIESFARVRTLSLSGRLLHPFVDRFIVQWPDLLKDGARGECHGWLV